MSAPQDLLVAEIAAEITAELARLHQEHGDPFRRARPAELTPLQKGYADRIQDEAITTYALISSLAPSRHRALALTHLEIAIDMAVKAATTPGALGDDA